MRRDHTCVAVYKHCPRPVGDLTRIAVYKTCCLAAVTRRDS
jgi:hypothetical protein